MKNQLKASLLLCKIFHIQKINNFLTVYFLDKNYEEKQHQENQRFSGYSKFDINKIKIYEYD